MFKKILSVALAVLMLATACVGFAGCGKDDDFKVGFIFLHDDKSTYDKNFMDAANAVQEELGFKKSQFVFKVSVGEDESCYEAAADLVQQGCDIVFADSFNHEAWMIKAAKEFPEVQFCHATGTKAHTENLANYHNAFAAIYEGRFLAGVAAGLKLNAMIEAKTITPEQAVMGYVGAYPYAEVISGYTSFYLGAKSVCPSVTMKVDFTGSWYDVDKEREKANALIDSGCVLISQHADSLGAPGACEAKSVPNVSYNGSTVATCPNTFIIASKINWAPYFRYMIDCVQNDKAIAADWTGTIANGAVELTAVNTTAAAAGTQEKIDEVKALLIAGTLHVFATNTFTVGGEVLTTRLADVHDMGDYVPETEAIKDGYFHESEYRSAPYFDLDIDGITRLDK